MFGRSHFTNFIIVSRQALSFVDLKTQKQLPIPISPEGYHLLEVLSPDKLVEEVGTFLKTQQLVARNWVVILDTTTTFTKTFPIQESPENTENQRSFLDNIPLARSTVLSILNKQHRQIIVANYVLVSAIQKALSQQSNILEAVVPLSVVGEANSVLEAVQLVSKANSKKILKTFNFLKSGVEGSELITKKAAPEASDGDKTSSEQELVSADQVGSPSKTRLLLLGSVLLMLLVIGGGLVAARSNWGKTFFETQPAASPIVVNLNSTTTTPEPSSIPEISPSPATASPELKAKSDLKLNILNGSQIRGQAGVVKTALEKQGFTSIDTGNFDQTQSQTSLVVTAQVPAEVVTQLQTELQAIFTKVELKTVPTLESYDVMIVTGTGVATQTDS
jgi:hypothetical protein